MTEHQAPLSNPDNAPVVKQEKKPDIGHDLKIMDVSPSRVGPTIGGSVMVCGEVDKFKFFAHIVEKTPPNPSWEIGDTGIIRLEVRWAKEDRVVYDWDRGTSAVVPERLQILKSMTQPIVDFLTSGALIEACHKHVTSLKESARISPAALAAMIDKMDRLANPHSLSPEMQPALTKREKVFQVLKQHWQESLQQFDKMEAAHGVQAPRQEAGVVEKLRAELDPRLKRVAEDQMTPPSQRPKLSL